MGLELDKEELAQADMETALECARLLNSCATAAEVKAVIKKLGAILKVRFGSSLCIS